MDDHVQETSDDAAQDKKRERPEMERHRLPDTQVKHVVEKVHARIVAAVAVSVSPAAFEDRRISSRSNGPRKSSFKYLVMLWFSRVSAGRSPAVPSRAIQSAIHILFERVAHEFDGSRFSGPDLQCFRALIQ